MRKTKKGGRPSLGVVTPFTVHLTKDQYRQLAKLAKKQAISMGETMRRLVNAAV